MVKQNQTVKVLVLDESGDYGDPIAWYGGKGTADPMWTKDGSKPIADGEVMIGNGCGVAVQNTVRVKDGAEVAKGGDFSKIYFQVSGEVDLVCKNLISAKNGFQISGNSTPVAINLKDVTPRLANGDAIKQNQTVKVLMLGTDGNYGDPIAWYGGKGTATPMWTKNGSDPIADAEGELAAGQGFAVQNTVRVKDGAEVAKGGDFSEVYLDLPLPIK